MTDAGAHIVVHGLVQGVCFRYYAAAACRAALASPDSSGTSRDGSVEIEAEGSREALEQFIAEVSSGPARVARDGGGSGVEPLRAEA